MPALLTWLCAATILGLGATIIGLVAAHQAARAEDAVTELRMLLGADDTRPGGRHAKGIHS